MIDVENSYREIQTIGKNMSKKRDIPHYAHMFLNRQGLQIMPSDNFLEKFKEFYIEINNKSGRHPHLDELNNETAIFFLNTLLESIVYCLDCNLTVYLRGLVLLNQKVTDYRHNVKTHLVSVVENVKKINFKIVSSMVLKISDKLSQNNKEYQDFIKKKKVRHQEIKDYYKEFYGKQNEWWL